MRVTVYQEHTESFDRLDFYFMDLLPTTCTRENLSKKCDLTRDTVIEGSTRLNINDYVILKCIYKIRRENG